MTSKKTRPRSPKRQPRRARRGPARKPGVFVSLLALVGWFLLGGVILGGLALGGYMLHLDGVIRAQFEGKRWALPARVYARPMELYAGMDMSAEQFAQELGLLHYRSVTTPRTPGSYSRDGSTFNVITRRFEFWDETEVSRHMQISFKGKKLQALHSLDGQEDPGLWRVEPAEIASIYPSHREDRILVKREEITPVLVDTLLAMEDRIFYKHWGIDPKGITRAVLANWEAGKKVQGGSTLTQQLVKNFFLTNERTYKRKINEILMAILIEWHYSKDDILEAYSNEVYLGQDGSRAIHGLGLASRFYFNRDLAELNLHHVALLVGLVRGPSYYDPRRYPERARQRRALVLDVMVEQGLVSSEDASIAKDLPLDVPPKAKTPSGISRYPAFMGLVKRQVRKYYREADLTTEGLKVFTTLDPQVQAVAEKSMVKKLPQLERKNRLKSGTLQGAAIIADTRNGEIQALVGGRDVRLDGFNRAIDAKRPAGSLLKPAVFLTALEEPDRYTLATLIDDSKPIIYTSGGKRWSPANYDKRFHGRVMLRDALAKSYNIATARIGLDMDVLKVVKTLQRLGIERELQPYPSLLLGAVDLAPLEIAQMYETFASGGFRTPLRAIREVTDATGNPLQHYSLTVEKVVEPGPAYLINAAMQQVVRAGTAKSVKKTLSSKLGLAGKTGTTDDYRDSWFAGFSGDRLAVVWLGRDDNKPTKLSGSTGALRVWIDMMAKLKLEPLDLAASEYIEQVLIDPRSGRRANRRCRGAQKLPFLKGSAPRASAPCSRPAVPKPSSGEDPIDDFFKRLLE